MRMLLLAKNLLFTIVVPGTVAVYVPLSVISHDAVGGVARATAGLFLIATGGCVYLWCIWDFASFGRGTPAPIDPPKRLVERGLYRYSRNPMYVGVLLIIFGWALLFRAHAIAIYGAIVALCFHFFVLFYEEPQLKRIFGPSYEQYCSRVGRWLPLRKPAAV